MTISLIALLRALDKLQAGTSASVSVSSLITFLEVAREEGRTLAEIARQLDLPDSTASRQLLDLGLRNRKREDGLNLVTAKTDLQDLRVRRYELTPKGRKLLRDALNAKEV